MLSAASFWGSWSSLPNYYTPDPLLFGNHYLERVSVNPQGSDASGDSDNPALSGDGRYVSFESDASDLVSDDTNGSRDIFVHDRQTGITTRVSVASDGSQANGYSYEPSISHDGRYVVFQSDASNLVPDDTNGLTDVFVHDRQNGQTRRVNGNDSLFNSIGPNSFISGNGRYVGYIFTDYQVHTNENAEPYALSRDGVVIDDQQTGISRELDLDWTYDPMPGYERYNHFIHQPTITPDGRYLAYYGETTFYNETASSYHSEYHVYIHDLQTEATRRLDVPITKFEAIQRAISITADAGKLALIITSAYYNREYYHDRNDVYYYDLQTDERQWLSAENQGGYVQRLDYFSEFVSMSADGRYVVLSICDPSEPYWPRGYFDNVYGGVLDTLTGQFQPIRITWDGNDPQKYSSSGFLETIDISADGSTLIFSCDDDYLVTGDNNGSSDIFVLPNPFFAKPAKGVVHHYMEWDEDDDHDGRNDFDNDLILPDEPPFRYFGTQFDSVIVGSRSDAQGISITNVGDEVLHIENVELPEGFVLVKAPQATLAPGERMILILQLYSLTPGTKTGHVRITTDSPVEPVLRFRVEGKVQAPPELAVFGNGQRIANNDTTPWFLDFTDMGHMTTNRGSVTRSFELRNLGEYPLSAYFSITGPAARDFTVENRSGQRVLRFNPSANGLRKATVEIHSNDPGTPIYRFQVQGTGVSRKTSPTQYISSGYTEYATIQPGTGLPITDGSALLMDMMQTKADGTILYTSLNPQNTPVLVRPWTNDIPWEYASMLQGIKAGEERVMFTNPNGNGILDDGWRWNYQKFRWEYYTETYAQMSAGEQHEIDDLTHILYCRVREVLVPEADLRGKGVAIAHGDKTPSLIDGTDFGSLSTREQVTHTFTLHNVGPQGTRLMDLYPGHDLVKITGAHAGDFVVGEITESDDHIITIPVTFKPSAAGVRNATLKISNYDQDESNYTIALTGKGTATMVTLEWIDSTAAETMPGQTPNPGIIRISTGNAPTDRPMTVYFTTAGPAIRTELGLSGDYLLKVGDTVLSARDRSFTIPAGASYVDVLVLPLNDTHVETIENVAFNLSTNGAYALPTAVAQRQAVISIVDNEPTVRVTAIDAQAMETGASEPLNPAVFRISRSGLTGVALSVEFTVAGTAVRGDDVNMWDYYLKVGNTVLKTKTNHVVIPADVLYVDVTVVPVDEFEGKVEPTETAVLFLKKSSNYHLSGNGAEKIATIQIQDNKPRIWLEVLDNTLREKPVGQTVNNAAYFRIHRAGATDHTFQIKFKSVYSENQPMASNERDREDYYIGLSKYNYYQSSYGPQNLHMYTMDSGVTSLDFRIVSTTDARTEPTELIILELVPDIHYHLSNDINQRRGVFYLEDAQPV